MQCTMSGETLSACVDGELTSPQAAAMREHAASCATCRARLAALRQTIGLVQAVKEAMPPAGLRARVLAQAAAELPALGCAEAGQRMDAYLDGELAALEGVSLEAHLAQCGGCRARYRLHEETVAALRTMPVLEPPLDMRARVQARRARPRLQPVWKAMAGTVGFAVAAAALMLALRTGEVPTGTTTVASRPTPQGPAVAKHYAAPARESVAAVSQAPAVASAGGEETRALAGAVRRGARRAAALLGRHMRPMRSTVTAAAKPAEAGKGEAVTVAAAVATADTTGSVPEPATAAAPAVEVPALTASPAPAVPAPAPEIASVQPVRDIVQLAARPRPQPEVVRVGRNQPRPVEVRAFAVEF